MTIHPTRRRTLVALPLVAALAASVACDAEHPVAPDGVARTATLVAPVPSLILAPATVTDLATVVDDATARVLPSLADTTSAAQLARSLRQAAAAVRAGDRTALVAALARANARLDALDAAHDEGAAPELSALRLALRSVEATTLGTP